MVKVTTFFKLIRSTNLLFIAGTQLLFYYCVMLPLYNEVPYTVRLTELNCFLLLLASTCIAAAGNIINDYFDINIDLINKPNQLIVGKLMSKRSAIAWHLLLSFIGICISFYISNELQQRWWWLGWCNMAVVFVLVLYSVSLKKKLIIGNVTIALLTAWVIIVMVLSQFQLYYPPSMAPYSTVLKDTFTKLFRIGILYATFAFVITLLREIVKDMEDIIGDQRNGCRTIPITWGTHISKSIVASITVVLILLLLLVQFYILQYYWYYAILFNLVAIVIPLVFSTKILIAATVSIHYHTLSTWYKYIILTGIISMIFFKVYET